jgi:ATP-dependent DNA helicase RecQ
MNTSDLLIENTLKVLHKNGIVTYIARTSKPQIIFPDGRLNTRDVIINKTNYENLKQASLKRLKEVKKYVGSTTKCRSEMLLKYFGQKETQRCGQCDICLSRNKLNLSQHEFNTVMDIIKPILLEKNMSLEDLLENSGIIEEERFIKVIRWLIDTGKVTEFGGNLIWVK